MKSLVRLLVVVAAIAATVFAAAAPARAEGSGGNAVFVQTNDPAGNAIDAFRRNGDGTLTFQNSYATGGLGGREAGSMSDPLASDGSLVQLPGGLLAGVNAGSNTISVFQVSGTTLHLNQVLPSGGSFPTSVAFKGNLVYVLNAGGPGTVSGFQVVGGQLQPIAASTRTLGLANSTPPFFLSSPAQVGFTPDRAHLVVTTKINSTVDIFSVSPDGTLSAAPVKNPAAGVPFAFEFDSAGRMVLNFAGTSSLETFDVNADNTITPVSTPASDNQMALCWITEAHGFQYASNTGSNDISQFDVLGNGSVMLVNPVAASNIPGATDSTAAGEFLYVQSGLSSTVHVFSVGAGGALTPVQVVAVPDGGSQEGIVVT
ncbi:MAG TPA: beta-propeller fold lactonase family protein [Candidatus Dormibacteraeota bacterium]|nr:beta-propeller fold lactonase family protein [Candidatus Dormibacteraeota bacterium]